MKEFDYTVSIEPFSQGGYNVRVPAIPEICTFGDTLEEAKQNAREAIECYIESQLKEGLSIPADIEPKQVHISVSI